MLKSGPLTTRECRAKVVGDLLLPSVATVAGLGAMEKPNSLERLKFSNIATGMQEKNAVRKRRGIE